MHDAVFASVADTTVDLVSEDNDYSLGLGKDDDVDDSLTKDDDNDSHGLRNGFDIDDDDE